MKISEMNDGMSVYGNFLINDCKRCVDNKGSAYLTVVLQDSSGIIEGRKWSSTEEDEAILVKGKVVFIDGKVNRYNNSLQLKILTAERVKEDDVKWSDFISSAPADLTEMKSKLDAYIASIENEDVRLLTEELVKTFAKRYYIWPAAVRNHHDYISGLLHHSITMADLALEVCRIYPQINRDVLLAGAIIHDLGKTVELSGVQATSFTLEGKLLGHISIGQAELRRAAKRLGMFDYDDLPDEVRNEKHPLYAKKEIAVCMEHMILSHHGQPDFGSPVRPLTREALALSMIDDLDAKMNILDKAYAPVEKGNSTAKLFNMDERYFYKPLYTQDASKPVGMGLQDVIDELKK